MIPNIIGGLALLFLIVSVVGGLTGRVRAKSCCSIADPTRDLRMRVEGDATSVNAVPD